MKSGQAGEKIAGEARVGAGPPTASSQEAGTGPLGPGHWMALQAPREGGVGGGDLGVLEQNQDQSSAVTNGTEAKPLCNKDTQNTAFSV